MTGAADWRTGTGDAWAAEWRRTDRSLAQLASHLDAAILAAAPAVPFRALDVGCGAGATAHALAAARPDAEVVGVDLSEPLLAVARDRPSLANLRVVHGDALGVAASVKPDLYISRHGVTFFDDATAAFAELARAAAPNAHLVFSCFADLSVNRFAADLFVALGRDGEAQADDKPGPFAFADPDRVTAILSVAGWAGEATHVDFAYRAGEGDDPVADAVAFFTRIGIAAPILREAPAADRPAMLDAVAAACARRLRDGAVDFPAAAWLWSASLQERAP